MHPLSAFVTSPAHVGLPSTASMIRKGSTVKLFIRTPSGSEWITAEVGEINEGSVRCIYAQEGGKVVAVVELSTQSPHLLITGDEVDVLRSSGEWNGGVIESVTPDVIKVSLPDGLEKHISTERIATELRKKTVRLPQVGFLRHDGFITVGNDLYSEVEVPARKAENGSDMGRTAAKVDAPEVQRCPPPDMSVTNCKSGTQLEYYSGTFGCWMPCEVTHVSAVGAVQIDIKPGHWFRADEIEKNFRKPGSQLPNLLTGGKDCGLNCTQNARKGHHGPEGKPQVNVLSGSQLQKIQGKFDWVRTENSQVHRNARQQVAQQTLKVCQEAGYSLDGRRVSLNRVQDMLAETRIVRTSDFIPRVTDSLRTPPLFVPHGPGSLMDVAVDRARSGRKVVALNAASAFQIGGGFFHGGRHALEESICMQSTLFTSLTEAPGLQLDGQRRLYHEQRHIPEDGAILSPHVEIFRGGTNEGYPFWAEPVELCAIVSIAMPNCNPQMTDAPVDRPASNEDYLALLESKFIAALTAASRVGADVIILPDAGCGVYKNSPEVVGNALGKVLLNKGFLSDYEEIHIKGSTKFTAAVMVASGQTC